MARLTAAASWIAALGALFLWITGTPPGELRLELAHGQFWALEVQFVLVASLAFLNLPRLWRVLDLRARDAVFLAVVSAGTLGIVLFAAPATNRIYYDEHIYQGVGQNLTDLHLAQMCNEGNVEYGSLQCSRGEYSKEPYGYPYLLSVAYRLFGVHERIAFGLNAVMAASLVPIVFLITVMLSGATGAGRCAAVIAALMPEQLRWAHSAAAEPSAALACAAAVLAALAFVRLRSTAALLWAVAGTVFAMQFRPECLLIAPLVVAIVALEAPAELATPRVWWSGLLGLALGAVYIGHLAAVRTERWGASGERFSATFLFSNLRTNGLFFLADWRFPVAYTALAVAALILWRSTRGRLIAALYFLLFWGVFLIFYAGSYNYGADDRFSLMTFAPLAVLAGVGAWIGAERVDGWVRSGPWARRGVLAAIVVQFLWYLPFVRAVGEEAWAARADVEFARTVARDLPRNAIVLTQNPHMFHLWGVNALQTSIAINEPGYAEQVLAPRYAGGVFLHWNFWCNVADPVQQGFCDGILNRFPHTAVREYQERNFHYAIYRLDLPSHSQDIR